MRVLSVLVLAISLAPFVAIAQSPESSIKEVNSIPITVEKLSELLVERELSAPAETISVNQAMVSSEIIGVIDSINFEMGQVVKKGEVLLSLDATDYKLVYQQANANLESNFAKTEQAKLRLERANNLNKNNYIAADDLLARQTDVNVIKADRLGLKVALQQAQRNIEKTQIKAPFDGVISQRHAQLGSYVTPGMALFEFIQTDQLEVEADIPMHLSATLNEASQINFIDGSTQYPLKLLRLSPIVERGSRTQKARFIFVNDQAPIGSGGELIWSKTGGLLPADLIVNRDGQLGVFTAINNKAVFVILENAQEGRPVPITLDTTTEIIVGGRERLQDGDRITKQ